MELHGVRSQHVAVLQSYLVSKAAVLFKCVHAFCDLTY